METGEAAARRVAKKLAANQDSPARGSRLRCLAATRSPHSNMSHIASPGTRHGRNRTVLRRWRRGIENMTTQCGRRHTTLGAAAAAAAAAAAVAAATAAKAAKAATAAAKAAPAAAKAAVAAPAVTAAGVAAAAAIQEHRTGYTMSLSIQSAGTTESDVKCC